MASSTNDAALATLDRFYQAETAYLASNGRDFSAIAAVLDPECVIYQPASLPYGGEWRRHAGFETWMRAFAQIWSALEVKDPETFSSGDFVFSNSHVSATVRATGQELDWPLLQVFKMRRGKILELLPFYWDTAKIVSALR